jgi:LDH2 family malate/lactate/ureidoglycolate dehydrogenase
MQVILSELRRQVERVLANSGYDSSEIPVIADILMYAQMRGNNQGIVKLTGKGMPKDHRAGPIGILKETPLSLLLDGNHNLGMVVVHKGMDQVLEKAAKTGFAILGTRNTASPSGAIGYFARYIARRGFIGWVFSGSYPMVAPWGSSEPLFGTNPIAIGIPARPAPVVLDMSTSSMAWFGIKEALLAGREIPDHVAFDKHGQPTTDPAQALEGAIRPFGGTFSGHKGFGLSLMVEMLTGPLVGATFCGIGSGDWGNLLFIIDPGLLTDREDFLAQTSQLADRVRNADKLDGVEHIFLPGERGDLQEKQAMETGMIEIEEGLYGEFLTVDG